MRKAIPLLVSFLLLSVWSGYSQQEPATLHGADGVPMIDYGDSKPYTINDIKIFGVKYLDPDILTASSGLMRGETVYIPGNAISQAVSRLWNQRYFSDVKVIAELLPDDMVNIEIYLQERPRVYRWGFEGIRKGEANTLLEDLKLKRGSELSDYVIDKNIKLIQKHFSGKGFRNTEVTARIEKRPRLSVRATRSNGNFVKAESFRLECNPTRIPFIGSRLEASSTVPDTSIVSICVPVEKVKVKLPNGLPSLLSTIASEKSIV